MSSHRAFLWVFALCLIGGTAAADEPKFDPQSLEFVEREVRPLLVERCYKCHGNLAEPKGGLKLTDRAAVLKGGDSGPAAVPSKPAESYLVETIGYREALQMPPDGKLTDAQIATLTKWVELGLPWPESTSSEPTPADSGPRPYEITDEQRQFWAFQKVRVAPSPTVEEAAWPRSEIDRYILARLEAEHLRHAPQADRRTLIRRATFDLIGLPPTPAEVEAFLADESPEAFAKMIDRLLASPRYGERWGRHWLDVARYTDSCDARDLALNALSDVKDAWRYRDWVVAAMNRDLPYDRFVIDQIAGDLVEPATPERLNVDGQTATGFLAIGPWGNGDADKEKMLTDIVDDQLNATSRAFLGLTITCARCHDHKFDPIPTADYYSLAGIFYSTRIIPDVGPKTGGALMLRIPLLSGTQLAAREQGKQRLNDLKSQANSLIEEDYRLQAKNLLGQTARYLMGVWDYQHPAEPAAKGPIDQFAAARQLDPRLLTQWIAYLGQSEPNLLSETRINSEGVIGTHAWGNGNGGEPVFKVNTTDVVAARLSWQIPPHSAVVHPSPTSSVAVAWRSPIAGVVRIRGRVADGDPNGGNGIGWTIARRLGHGTQKLLSGLIDNGGKQDLAALPNIQSLDQVEVQPGDILWLAISPRGDYGYDTTVVELEISEAIPGGRTWSLARDVIPDPLDDGHGNPHRDALGNADVWQFFELAGVSENSANVEPDSPLDHWFAAVAGVNAGPGKRALVEQVAGEIERTALAAAPGDPRADRWLNELISANGPLRPADKLNEKNISEVSRQRLAELRGQIAAGEKEFAESLPTANGAQEGGVPGTVYEGLHDARIQVRGSYLRLGESVPRRFPRILAGDEQTPISQGSGRMELAKWLANADNPLTARVMVNRIWQHHFGEGIVRSANNFGKLGERPSHPELLDYLADRFVKLGWSIKAMHREIMLSATYQQSSIGETGTVEHDPDNRLLGRANRWRLESEAIRDSLLAAAGRLDLAMGGPALRDFAAPRRTLYLMTIRSERSGFGVLFDGADPLLPVEARTVSTVAPQSLFLMNNEFVVAQAAALADRILAESPAAAEAVGTTVDAKAGAEPRERASIERLYQLLYARGVTDREAAVGRDLLAARRAVSDERTAWIAYCQVLLCANEFIYID
jgi:Protein of unknown function (DUF1549)/Protein of unknown function (DUF1553)/Planctomycete cytochrome C